MKLKRNRDNPTRAATPRLVSLFWKTIVSFAAGGCLACLASRPHCIVGYIAQKNESDNCNANQWMDRVAVGKMNQADILILHSAFPRRTERRRLSLFLFLAEWKKGLFFRLQCTRLKSCAINWKKINKTTMYNKWKKEQAEAKAYFCLSCTIHETTKNIRKIKNLKEFH